MNINRPPPKRLAIIIALQEHLEGISEIDGAAFTMAGRVYTDRILIGEELVSNPPCISIIEAVRPDFATFAGEENFVRKDDWTIMIQGFVANDRTENTVHDAHYLAQDVARRLLRLCKVKENTGRPLFPDEWMLGGKIAGIEIAPPIVRPPEVEVSRNAFFYIPIRLSVAMEVGE